LIFTDPDDAVRAYARAIEKSGMPSRSVVAHGREYEERCKRPRCRAKRARRAAAYTRALKRAEKRAEDCDEPSPVDWVEVYNAEAHALVQRCAYCLRPREWVDSYVMGGQVGGGKKGRPPSTMTRAADMARISELVENMSDATELGPGVAGVYVRYAATGLSMDSIAVEASEQRIGGRTWSPADVRRCVRQGRSWLRGRLERKGLYRAKRPRFRGVD
jgi:hypothetical protein